MRDGADIITISLNDRRGDPLAAGALVRAMDMGVPVIYGMGNGGKPMAETNAMLNTTVGVGALDALWQKADYSDYGTGLTVMAFGGPVTLRAPDANGNLTVVGTNAGTSLAAPMVAGALALAKQKWPTANVPTRNHGREHRH